MNRSSRVLSVWCAWIALLCVVSLAPCARAADVWRLAGTFNAWNASDDSWMLSPVAGAPGVFELVREAPAGAHQFKFVKNGDWGAGHFGGEGPQGRGGVNKLAQPGADISLNLPGAAGGTWKFTLDTNARRWSVEIASLREWALLARPTGLPVVAQPFEIDLSASLVESWDAVTLSVACDDSGVQAAVSPRSRNMLRVTSATPGDKVLRIEARDAAGAVRATLEQTVTVSEGYVLTMASKEPVDVRIVEPGPARDYTTKLGLDIAMSPMGGGVHLWVVEARRPAKLAVLSVRERSTGRVLLETRDVVVREGTWAIEVRDGAVVRADDDPRAPFLLAGPWACFSCTLPAAQRVHVEGDMNGWAAPGSAGEIELVRRSHHGLFTAAVRVAEGGYAYRLRIDGTRIEPDRGNPRTTMNDRGEVCSLLVAGRTPADFPPVRNGHINVSGIRHEPSSPTGATVIEPDLGLADVSISALPGDVKSVVLNLHGAGDDGAEIVRRVPMAPTSDRAGFDRWYARVMSGEPGLIYSFTLADGPAEHTTERYTAQSDAAPDLPAWAMGAVWYQIFPERFRNGNPLNDPHGPGVFKPEWTSDWYATQPGERDAWMVRAGLSPDDPTPQRIGGELFNWVWDRRYGGDLQGIVQQLDYIESLGVTAIYLNPVFEAESMHKYDATDFRHIDDNFGAPDSAGRVPEVWAVPAGETTDPATWSWTAADRYFVDEFLPACRARGIRVVIDGVFNHTGRAFWAFKDIEERGAASPYKDWFFCEFDENGELESFQSWFNTGSLPKFRQTAEGDLVPPVKQHIFDITRRWMDPNGDGDPSDGVDGWRLDVALDVGMPFWRDWRRLVKGINPDAVIIAEIWDPADPYLRGDAFDTQMHYPFADAVADWLGVEPGMTAEQLGHRLRGAFNDAPQTNLIHQNLFDSHDTDRFVSMLHNPGRGYDQRNRAQDADGQGYTDSRPAAETYALAVLGHAFAATYTGAPMIYYGNEVGMWGADDPTNRKPMPWPDLGDMQRADEQPDLAVREAIAQWMSLRRDPDLGPPLRYGVTRHRTAGSADVFAFERELNGARVLVVVNRGEAEFDASALARGAGRAADASAMVPPRSARWWYFPN